MKHFSPINLSCILFVATGFVLSAQQPVPLSAPLEANPRFDPSAQVLPPAKPAAPMRVTPPRTSSPNRLGSSDLGLQRPVAVKSRGFDYFIGFSTRTYYSSNPSLSQKNDPMELPAGIFQNNLHTGFRLGSYNWGQAAFSPYVGVSYTRLDHFGDKNIDIFDYSTLGLYSYGLVQFPSGWAIKSGISYYNDRESNNNERIYYEIFPNLSILKTFSLGKSVSLLDFSIGHHFTDSVAYSGLGFDDALDRFELSARWTISTYLGKLEISPHARISFLTYGKGNMRDRNDLLRELGLNLEYPFNKYISANLFVRYVSRLSKDGPASFDFNRFDGGGGASLNAKF